MWLRRVPMVLVESYLAMLPRLEAEEAIDAASRVGVGSGTMSADTSRRLRRTWERLAEGNTPRPRLTPSVEQLSVMGFRFIPRSEQRPRG
jgi:hypothetical protein